MATARVEPTPKNAGAEPQSSNQNCPTAMIVPEMQPEANDEFRKSIAPSGTQIVQRRLCSGVDCLGHVAIEVRITDAGIRDERHEGVPDSCAGYHTEDSATRRSGHRLVYSVRIPPHADGARICHRGVEL